MNTAKRDAKRDIGQEILDSLDAFKQHDQGKITLKKTQLTLSPFNQVNAQLVRDTRKQCNMSRGVFAAYLRVPVRTLEKWEQGQVKPSSTAATLIMLVNRYPDTLDKLEKIN